jgi:hypothetical protein
MISRCVTNDGRQIEEPQWYGFLTDGLPRGTVESRPVRRCNARQGGTGGVRCGPEEWVARSASGQVPDVAIEPETSGAQDGGMQMIHPTVATGPARGPLVAGALVGLILLAGGVVLAYLTLVTPLVSGLTPTAIRPAPDQIFIGAIIWGATFVAPPSFALIGLVRLAHILSVVRRRNHGLLGPVAAALGDDIAVAPFVRLPEGRIVRNVVAGSYGVAILAELPPTGLSRHTGNTWEIRGANGRWVPFESPLERTARDAEGVRRWIDAEERDFVVKVYAAVVSTDSSLVRTPTCAVISPAQIPAWLGSLPPQRTLNPDRRAELIDRIRSIA